MAETPSTTRAGTPFGASRGDFGLRDRAFGVEQNYRQPFLDGDFERTAGSNCRGVAWLNTSRLTPIKSRGEGTLDRRTRLSYEALPFSAASQSLELVGTHNTRQALAHLVLASLVPSSRIEHAVNYPCTHFSIEDIGDPFLIWK